MMHNHTRIWISALVEGGRRYVDSPVLASILVLGWVPVALSAVAVDPSEATPLFVLAQASAALMVVFGPFDVWYYDERLLPGFFESIEDIVGADQSAELDRLAERYDRWFSTYWWVVTGPWMALVVAVFFVSDGYFASQGITGTAEYWSYFGFFLYWGLFSGLGFHGGIVTILTVREFSERIDLSIDPLHPDGLGGLSLVGEYAIRTTLILSTGALALPLSFQIATSIGVSEPVYVGVALYVVLIAVIFLYPTLKVNRQAQTLREEVLEEYRGRIRRLESRLSDRESVSVSEERLREEQSLQLEIRRLRREFNDHREVQLYPLSMSILIQLLSSLFLPILFIFFEFFLSAVL